MFTRRKLLNRAAAAVGVTESAVAPAIATESKPGTPAGDWFMALLDIDGNYVRAPGGICKTQLTAHVDPTIPGVIRAADPTFYPKSEQTIFKISVKSPNAFGLFPVSDELHCDELPIRTDERPLTIHIGPEGVFFFKLQGDSQP